MRIFVFLFILSFLSSSVQAIPYQLLESNLNFGSLQIQPTNQSGLYNFVFTNQDNEPIESVKFWIGLNLNDLPTGKDGIPVFRQFPYECGNNEDSTCTIPLNLTSLWNIHELLTDYLAVCDRYIWFSASINSVPIVSPNGQLYNNLYTTCDNENYNPNCTTSFAYVSPGKSKSFLTLGNTAIWGFTSGPFPYDTLVNFSLVTQTSFPMAIAFGYFNATENLQIHFHFESENQSVESILLYVGGSILPKIPSSSSPQKIASIFSPFRFPYKFTDTYSWKINVPSDKMNNYYFALQVVSCQ